MLTKEAQSLTRNTNVTKAAKCDDLSSKQRSILPASLPERLLGISLLSAHGLNRSMSAVLQMLWKKGHRSKYEQRYRQSEVNPVNVLVTCAHMHDPVFCNPFQTWHNSQAPSWTSFLDSAKAFAFVLSVICGSNAMSSYYQGRSELSKAYMSGLMWSAFCRACNSALFCTGQTARIRLTARFIYFYRQDETFRYPQCS